MLHDNVACIPMELLIQKDINISYIHMWIVLDIRSYVATYCSYGGKFSKGKIFENFSVNISKKYFRKYFRRYHTCMANPLS